MHSEEADRMDIPQIIIAFEALEEDRTVPKNVRLRLQSARNLLEDINGKTIEVKIDEIIQDLEDMLGDPNLPVFTRTQLFSLTSMLESR